MKIIKLFIIALILFAPTHIFSAAAAAAAPTSSTRNYVDLAKLKAIIRNLDKKLERLIIFNSSYDADYDELNKYLQEEAATSNPVTKSIISLLIESLTTIKRDHTRRKLAIEDKKKELFLILSRINNLDRDNEDAILKRIHEDRKTDAFDYFIKIYSAALRNSAMTHGEMLSLLPALPTAIPSPAAPAAATAPQTTGEVPPPAASLGVTAPASSEYDSVDLAKLKAIIMGLEDQMNRSFNFDELNKYLMGKYNTSNPATQMMIKLLIESLNTIKPELENRLFSMTGQKNELFLILGRIKKLNGNRKNDDEILRLINTDRETDAFDIFIRAYSGALRNSAAASAEGPAVISATHAATPASTAIPQAAGGAVPPAAPAVARAPTAVPFQTEFVSFQAEQAAEALALKKALAESKQAEEDRQAKLAAAVAPAGGYEDPEFARILEESRRSALAHQATLEASLIRSTAPEHEEEEDENGELQRAIALSHIPTLPITYRGATAAAAAGGPAEVKGRSESGTSITWGQINHEAQQILALNPEDPIFKTKAAALMKEVLNKAIRDNDPDIVQYRGLLTIIHLLTPENIIRNLTTLRNKSAELMQKEAR